MDYVYTIFLLEYKMKTMRDENFDTNCNYFISPGSPELLTLTRLHEARGHRSTDHITPGADIADQK